MRCAVCRVPITPFSVCAAYVMDVSGSADSSSAGDGSTIQVVVSAADSHHAPAPGADLHSVCGERADATGAATGDVDQAALAATADVGVSVLTGSDGSLPSEPGSAAVEAEAAPAASPVAVSGAGEVLVDIELPAIRGSGSAPGAVKHAQVPGSVGSGSVNGQEDHQGDAGSQAGSVVQPLLSEASVDGRSVRAESSAGARVPPATSGGGGTRGALAVIEAKEGPRMIRG